MLKMEMNVESRQEKGSKACGRLRKEGYVPAVVYGAGVDAVDIKVSTKDFIRKTVTENMDNVLLTLKIDGKKEKLAILRDVQKDPIDGHLIHIDFNEISMGSVISTNVHIELIGDCKGEKEGGVVEFQTRSISVDCKPADLPEHIDVDISDLSIGDSIHVADLKVSDKIHITTHDDVVIVSVSEPEEIPAEPEEGEEAEEAKEPELITKGKKEEEEESAE